MWKTSTEIESLARLTNEERAIGMIAKAGFDAWDFSMFRMMQYDWKTGKASTSHHPLGGAEALSFARRLRHVGEECGIVCNQSHAPFPTVAAPIRACLKRAIECTAEAGGTICVIHPMNSASVEENAEMFAELLPFAKDCGVTIATENMWNWADDHATPAACSDPGSFLAHLDAVGDDHFAACLDIGHAEMKGLGTSAAEMIRALGDRLCALHIHDNDLHRDSHQIPYSMQIDFAAVADALVSVGYRGYLTLEADRFLHEGDDLAEQVTQLFRSVRRLAEQMEERS